MNKNNSKFTELFFDEVAFFFDSAAETLALLVARVREYPLSLNAFARFSIQVSDNRRHFFRQFSLDAQRAELDMKLIRMFHL